MKPDLNRKVLSRVSLLMVMVSLSHCQKASETSESQPQQGALRTKPPLVVRRARAVVYKLARQSTPMKQTNIDLAHGNLSITLRPNDFKNSEITCKGDECTATLIEPITAFATIPTGLNTKIKVQYRQARQSHEALFSHYAVVGGQWTLLKVGDILSITIEAGIAFESTPQNNFKPVLRDIYCSKSLSCETPLFVINGMMDKNGIQFDSRLVATGQEGDYVKIVSDFLSKNQRIPFDSMKTPPWVEKLSETPVSRSPCNDKKSYDTLWSINDDKKI